MGSGVGAEWIILVSKGCVVNLRCCDDDDDKKQSDGEEQSKGEEQGDDVEQWLRLTCLQDGCDGKCAIERLMAKPSGFQEWFT